MRATSRAQWRRCGHRTCGTSRATTKARRRLAPLIPPHTSHPCSPPPSCAGHASADMLASRSPFAPPRALRSSGSPSSTCTPSPPPTPRRRRPPETPHLPQVHLPPTASWRRAAAAAWSECAPPSPAQVSRSTRPLQSASSINQPTDRLDPEALRLRRSCAQGSPSVGAARRRPRCASAPLGASLAPPPGMFLQAPPRCTSASPSPVTRNEARPTSSSSCSRSRRSAAPLAALVGR